MSQCPSFCFSCLKRLAGASSSGYPGAAYPGATYPGQHMGGPHMGGHTTHGGGSGGGLLGSLGGLGGVLGAATMGAAILNPVSNIVNFKHAHEFDFIGRV